MKPVFAVGLSILIAVTSTPADASNNQVDVSLPPAKICVTPVTPTSTQFTVIKQLKIGKGTYGEVDQTINMLAAEAREIGADAVINYTGSQRFGFWPWRFVHPVARGTAIKWNGGETFDCTASGGSLR